MTSTHLQGAIETRANVYFDGRCVSHTVMSPDGTKKSVGVILPSTLTFTTGAPERMEVVDGHCRVKLAGGEWVSHSAGRSFEVPGQSSFEIEVTTALHYICHFG